MKRTLLVTILYFASGIFNPALSACGKITIADMNWPSASLMAHLDNFILKHGFGCQTELVPGDTIPTSTSMIEKGKPDIAPELWSNSISKQLALGVSENRLRIAGNSLSDGGEEGFWIPKYMVDKDSSLATIKGIINNAKLFKHSEYPNKSAFIGCPAGWNCQITTGHLFRALRLAEFNFLLVDPGSPAGLDGTLARAYERRLPWFGYYWAPTAMLGKYDMVKVDFESGIDEDHWKSCISKVECTNPKVSMFPSSPILTVTSEKFASQASDAYDYLTKRSFKNKQMNKLLKWMNQNQADGETTAVYYLKNRPDLWMLWVPPNISAKVKKALKNL